MRAEYSDSLGAIFGNSAFITRRRLLRAIAGLVRGAGAPSGGSWLDVGCGLRPYEALFSGCRYVGVDVEHSGRAAHEKRPDLVYDGKTLPVETGSFDGVVCTQVLEHAEDPRALLRELSRALKPGGALVLTLPFVWPQHEKPYDFLRFTEFSTREMLAQAGLRVERFEKTSGAVETIAQLASAYLAQDVIARLPRGKGVLVAALCAPLQLAGLALQPLLPDAGDLYLDNAVLARKP